MHGSGWLAPQILDAKAAFQELLRESTFLNYNASLERGGKVNLEQAITVLKVRGACARTMSRRRF